MARSLSVYPKVVLNGSTWFVSGRVDEFAAGTHSEFKHVVAAGVTTEVPLQLLKIVFDLTVEDTDTDSDVDDALFVDDIKPGNGEETVWGNWQERAEGIITGLSLGYTEEDFWATWTMGDTQAMRQDAQRALESGPGGIGRGWMITFFHQHEGDGSVSRGSP
jgi:hypothetical protein